MHLTRERGCRQHASTRKQHTPLQQQSGALAFTASHICTLRQKTHACAQQSGSNNKRARAENSSAPHAEHLAVEVVWDRASCNHETSLGCTREASHGDKTMATLRNARESTSGGRLHEHAPAKQHHRYMRWRKESTASANKLQQAAEAPAQRLNQRRLQKHAASTKTRAAKQGDTSSGRLTITCEITFTPEHSDEQCMTTIAGKNKPQHNATLISQLRRLARVRAPASGNAAQTLQQHVDDQQR